MYNFHVKEWASYFVGEIRVYVHNNKGHIVNSRLPKNNGHWSGKPGDGEWFSDIQDVIDITGGKWVPFKNGRPNFSNWKKGSLRLKKGVLNGTEKDFGKVYDKIKLQKGFSSRRQAKKWLHDNGLTPHHKSSTVIELIPTKLHSNVPHIGSASDMRKY